MGEGSIPEMQSGLKLDPIVGADVSLRGSLVTETINKGKNMSIRTKIKIGLAISILVRKAQAIVIVGLLGLAAGLVPLLV